MATAFRSRRVLTPHGLAPTTLLVEQERITGVRGWDDGAGVSQLHDFGNSILLPGLVDTHVHINEPGRTEWEGFATATRAAAAGGVTTLVDMPLNCRPETVNVSALANKRSAASGKTWVDWAAWGGLVRGNVDALAALAAEGVAGFKCFLVHSGIETFAWIEQAQLSAALTSLRGSALPLLAHAEVGGPIERATALLESRGADWRRYATFLASRPDKAEVEAIALLIRLAEDFQSPVHIVHLSSAQAVPMLADARRRGVPVTVETCPHYLWFAAEDILDGATEFKCAPPIRGAANREALWEALVDGTIDMVATDHSPSLPALKHRDSGRFDMAWGGISSLGLALPMMWTAMMQRGMSANAAIKRVGNWMAAAPAQLAGLRGRKGGFDEGADADLVVFDPDVEWIIGEDQLHFRHKLSPYLGARVQGQVLETWLRGEPVYKRRERGAPDDGFVGGPRGRGLLRS